MYQHYALLPVLALLSTVDARKVRIGSSGSSSSFDPPPVQIVNLAAYSLFLLAALIQLASTLPALSRKATRLPAAGAAIALTILAIGDALSVAIIATAYTINGDGLRPISGLASIQLQVASLLFYKWTDPAILAAVALVLYNRYRTVQKGSSVGLVAFAGAAGVILVLMVVLIVANAAIIGATETAQFHRNISFLEVRHRFQRADDIFHAYVAFNVLGTLLLAVAAVLVKTRLKKDTVMSWTLFAIIPLLLLHALARLIFAILEVRLPLLGLDVADALDLTTTILYGIFYLAAMSVLVFLLGRARLWDETRLSAPPAVGAVPYVGQATPPAQFPGQWGYPQPPNAPQYAYVPVYPGQGPPGLTPVHLQANEKA